MANGEGILNEFMEECFYSILDSEKRSLESLANGKLTIKEIHLVDMVFRSQKIGDNNFSRIADKLGITLGTLTTAFNKLEKKGYLKKERYLIDNRVYYITTTSLAEKILKEHGKWHEKLVSSVLQVVPEKDRDNFINAFKSLTEYFRKKTQ